MNESHTKDQGIVYDMGCKSVVTSNIHRACKMFGFSFDNFLNVDDSVGDDRLFKLTLIKEKRLAINSVKELIRLREGIRGFSHAPTLSRRDLQIIIEHVTTAIV